MQCTRLRGRRYAGANSKMKTLILLRHAKSSWKDDSLADIDRPLKDRGISDADLIGEWIRQQKIVPDLVLSSPAKRARQTAELVLKSARLKVEPRFEERIYEASTRQLFQVLSHVEDAVTSLILIGHNPGFEDLLRS